jgi:hypothetical protein
MRTYKVRPNEHYFKGPKMQLIYLQISLCLVSVLISMLTGNCYWLIAFPILLFGFSGYLSDKTGTFYFKAKFDNDCLYQLKENYDQINKLYGFSTGFHHHNSARFGWRCVDNETIEILAYCYINGKRISKTIMNVKPGDWTVFSIQSKTDKYVFRVMSNKNPGKICIINKEKGSLKYELLKLFIYKLFPYFGGRVPSPKEMNISILDLKKFSYDE